MAASPGSDNNAVNAADPTSGLVCIVRGSETDPYRYDTACSYHRVDKFNKDGTRAWFRYQDKGTLQPGNEVPETGGQWDITQNWDADKYPEVWLEQIKAQDKAVCLLGGGPGRVSTMQDAAVLRAYPEYAVLREQLRYADPDWRPIIAQWDEINTGPLGAAVFQGMTGVKTPRQALLDILPRVNDIMSAGGYR